MEFLVASFCTMLTFPKSANIERVVVLHLADDLSTEGGTEIFSSSLGIL